MNEPQLRDGEPQLIDVRHLDRPNVIGAWRVGDVLIDPGPSSTLDALLPGSATARRARSR